MKKQAQKTQAPEEKEVWELHDQLAYVKSTSGGFFAFDQRKLIPEATEKRIRPLLEQARCTELGVMLALQDNADTGAKKVVGKSIRHESIRKIFNTDAAIDFLE